MGNKQAKEQPSSPTTLSSQDAPILRLYHDLWLHLCHYLDARSLANLIFTGNPTIASHVVRNTRSTRFHGGGLIWNLKPLLNFSKRFQSIQELIISTKQMTCLALKPNTTLTLPPTLTTLDLSFYGIFSAIQPIRLSQAVPVLTRLSLDNHGSRKPHMLSDFDLPLSLQTLCLECNPDVLGLTPQGIAQLPRTLADLSMAYLSHDQEHERQGVKHRFDSYLWPLSLTSCRLRSDHTNLRLEHLPRTVTRLDISRHIEQETLSGQFELSHFPWRVFFPRLRNISLPNQDSRTSLSGHLQSLIMPRFMDETKVESFMNSGFWLLSDELGPIWKDTYPTYERIKMPNWQLCSQQVEEDLEILAPYLKRTSIPGIPYENKLYKLFSPLKKVKFSYGTSQGDEPFPSGTRTLHSVWPYVHAALVPSSVTTLNVGNLIGSGLSKDQRCLEGDLPVSLLSLTMGGDCSLDWLSIIPRTLTHLSVKLSSASEWDLLATRLVSLSKLKVLLSVSWNRYDPLMCFMSQQLGSLTITQSRQSDIPPAEPSLHQFFPNPPIFPPSLTRLFLKTDTVLASILPKLPRSLTKIKISSFAWTSEEETEKISPQAAIQGLPPNLRILEFISTPDDWDNSKSVSWEVLRELPRSILSFKENDHFQFPPSTDLQGETFINTMPPYLVHFMRAPTYKGTSGFTGFTRTKSKKKQALLD